MCDKQIYNVKDEILSEMRRMHNNHALRWGRIEVNLKALAHEKKIQNGRLDKYEAALDKLKDLVGLGERERKTLFERANTSPFWLAWKERFIWLMIVVVLILGINVNNLIGLLSRIF